SLGAVERDLGRTGIEHGAVAILRQHRPRGRLRLAREHSDRPPSEVDPPALRLAPLDYDADGDDHLRGGAHEAASVRPCAGNTDEYGDAIGNPINRFCGFMRRTRSGVIANIR